MPEKETIKHIMCNLEIESYMKPSFPINNFEKFVDKVIKDEEMQDLHGRDYESAIDFDAGEIQMLTLMLLYDKGMITKEQIKSLLKGQDFHTTCMGEWQEVAKKELGVFINRPHKK
jgi:hypothetical protein